MTDIVDLSIIRRTSAVIAIGLAVTLAGGCTKEQAAETAPKEQRLPVKVIKVSPSSYKEYGEYYGTVGAFEEADLITYAGGRVNGIKAKAGDKVKKGDRLCDVDGSKYGTIQESAALAERIAKEKFQRSQAHLKQGSGSRLLVDNNRLAYLQAKSTAIDASRSRDGAYCVSPIDGIVVKRYIDLHAELQPGQRTFTVAEMNKVKLKVGIPESAIAGYQEGREVQISHASYPGKVWQGELYSLARMVNESNRSFEAEIHVDNADGTLKPGQTAKARILKFDLANQMVVPTQAVLTKASELVVMVAKDGVAHQRSVIAASSNEDSTMITEGLKTGEQLIVSGHAQAAEGTPIEIVE